jgi:membrane associated rhomboid family serine protease
MTDTVKHLIIINVLVFLATNFIGIPDNNYQMLALYSFGNPNFEWYQFVTHMFMHSQIYNINQISFSDFIHIGFNMFGLYSFGSVLEHFWGRNKFLFFYISCGLGAALINNLYNFYIGNIYSAAVGASGALYGLLVAYGYMFPNAELIIFPIPIPIKAKYFIPGIIAIDLFFGLKGQSMFGYGGTGIAHFAHIGGALFGFFIMWNWRNNKYNRN